MCDANARAASSPPKEPDRSPSLEDPGLRLAVVAVGMHRLSGDRNTRRCRSRLQILEGSVARRKTQETPLNVQLSRTAQRVGRQARCVRAPRPLLCLPIAASRQLRRRGSLQQGQAPVLSFAQLSRVCSNGASSSIGGS